MTSEIFAAIVISSTAGAVFGVILKHVLDTRHIKKINAIWEEALEKTKAEDKRFEDGLRDIIKRQDELIARLQARAQAKPKTNFRECSQFFEALVNEPLPEDGNDLDFPNSIKEGK